MSAKKEEKEKGSKEVQASSAEFARLQIVQAADWERQVTLYKVYAPNRTTERCAGYNHGSQRGGKRAVLYGHTSVSGYTAVVLVLTIHWIIRNHTT